MHVELCVLYEYQKRTDQWIWQEFRKHSAEGHGRNETVLIEDPQSSTCTKKSYPTALFRSDSYRLHFARGAMILRVIAAAKTLCRDGQDQSQRYAP